MIAPTGSDAAERPPQPSAAPPAAPAPWVVLVEAGAAPARPRPAVSARRVVTATAVVAVAIAAVVSVAGLWVSRHIAERQAVHDVAQLTDTLAQSIVQPALTDAMATDATVARAALDPLVKQRLISDSLVRVKLWTPGGTVLYSDEPRLIGQTFTLDPEARAIFTDPRIEADVTDLQRPENQFERDQGKLLEVYRPVWTPSGEPLLFESYFRYDIVAQRSHELWRGFAGIMLSSVAALVLLLIPLVWLVVTRARRAQLEREHLIRRTLDASAQERRRIAASLHDGVVQDLAGASFAVAGQAERAAASHDADLARELTSAASTIRGGIAGLRALLVDIYPRSLHTSGLGPALRDLARGSTVGDATVSVSVDDATAEALSPEAREAAYRVAQESVRNAIRHGAAHNVRVSLSPVGEGQAQLDVDDDGAGFDVSTATRAATAGHLGLHLMADAARSCAARLALSSAPGWGTRVRLSVAVA